MKTDPPLTRRGFSGQDRSRKGVAGVGGADGDRTRDLVNAIHKDSWHANSVGAPGAVVAMPAGLPAD
jgi:hypothetical protein